MLSNKWPVIKFLIVNLVLSIVLLFGSIALSALVTIGWDEGLPMTGVQNWIVDLGELSTTYLLLLVFALPESLQQSFITGPLSYISAFVMTLPITLLFYFLFRSLRRSFKKPGTEQ